MSTRVLIIEDDADIAGILAVNLADLGAETRMIGNGLDGMRVAAGGGWDLVILDLMLPGLDGIEVCRRLRAKLGADPADPRYILTVWGVGYRFAEAP